MNRYIEFEDNEQLDREIKKYIPLGITLLNIEINKDFAHPITINAENANVMVHTRIQKLVIETCQAHSIQFQINSPLSLLKISGEVQIHSVFFYLDNASIENLEIVNFNKRSQMNDLNLTGRTPNKQAVKNVKIEGFNLGNLNLDTNVDNITILNTQIISTNNLLSKSKTLTIKNSTFEGMFPRISNQTFDSLILRDVKFEEQPTFSLACKSFEYTSTIPHNASLKLDNCSIGVVNLSLMIEQLEISSSKFGFLTIKSDWQTNILKITKSIIEETLFITGNTIRHISLIDSVIRICVIKAKSPYVIFENTTFENLMDLSGCIFKGFQANSSKFNGKNRLKKTHFLNAPLFSTCHFSPDINFTQCKFKSISDDDIGTFRNLKHQMINVENYHDEILFSALELEAYSKSNFKFDSLHVWLLGILYKLANNYGRSVAAPFGWIALTWGLGWLASYHYGAIYTPPTSLYPLTNTWLNELHSTDQIWHSAINSAYHSLGPIKFLTQFNIYTPQNMSLVWIQVAQVIISSLLWYLAISGIRRHFKS